MKANLIKSLKNTAEVVEIEAGRSARRNFPGVDFENAVLIINGKISTPDTIIQDNDTVTLRLIPGDLTDTPWWVATFIIPFGFLIQPAELAYKAREQAAEAEAELEKIKRMTNAPSIDNRPFLRGATNAIATGKSQPYFCGRNFLTPYLFTKPYYKISGNLGNTQEVINVLEGGFKGVGIDIVGIGDTSIAYLNAAQNGVYSVGAGIFANGQVEIRQDGQLFQAITQANYKVNSKIVNREITEDYKIQEGNGEYLVLTLDPCALDVEICINFPYGLYEIDEESGEEGASAVTIIPEVSFDGGATWTSNIFTWHAEGYTPLPFPFPTNYILEYWKKSVRLVGNYTFNLDHYRTLAGRSNILIRIRNASVENQYARRNCYVYYYQSRIFDPLKSSTPAGVLNDGGAAGLVPCLNVEARERSLSNMIAIKLVANENNKDKLTQINIIATSLCRTWNGSAWSTGKTETRNPAAIALEILTSPLHPASKYDDTEIDLDAFGAFYEYCQNNDLYFDDLITQPQKKDAELKKIADACGVAFYKDIYGRYSVAIDQAQENAVAVYNPQNIISLTNKKTFARRVDALRVKYIDSTNNTYKENTYTVTRLENGQPVTIDENSIIKEIDAPGITRQSQVVKYARRLMAIDELRPVTTTLKIGAEGVYYTPFAKIEIQDPSINHDAQDTIIDSVTYQYGLLKKIYLKQPVNFADPLKAYGIVINAINENGATPVALKVEGEGITKELDVITDYSISQPEPTTGNVASFGELDIDGEFSKITHEYIITRIARTDGGFNLDLQEYNEAIYNPGTIPAYKPIVNNTPTLEQGTIPPDAVTHEELDNKVIGINADTVQAAVDTIQNGYRFSNVYRVRPVEDTLEEVIAKIDDEARNRSASISITEDEILLQVQDMEKELVGLIDIQAGAVTALVQGGGASGQMSLTLNLPIMIDATKRAQFVAASSEEKVAAVYALVDGTEYYGIKGYASNAAVKALWDDAIAAGLIASQIDLTATQIKLSAENIYLDGDVIVNNENKIKAALIDAANILTTNIAVKDKGVIHSDNYNGTIDANGNITAYGSTGWAIDHAGNADFVNLNATGGNFWNVNISGSISNSTIRCIKIDSRNFYIPKHGYFIAYIYMHTSQQTAQGFPTSYDELIGVVLTNNDVYGGSTGNKSTDGYAIANRHILQLDTYTVGRDTFIKVNTNIDINDYESGQGLSWIKVTRTIRMSGLVIYDTLNNPL